MQEGSCLQNSPMLTPMAQFCKPHQSLSYLVANTTLLNALPKQVRHDKPLAWFVVCACQRVGYL